MLLNESLVDSFTEWARCVEPRLRHALTASFGSQLGKDAAADALAHAWVHWDVVSVTENRLGYVYGVGRNHGPPQCSPSSGVSAGRRRAAPGCRTQLPEAIAALPERQRVVITLVYGYEWTLSEVAELLGTTKIDGAEPCRARTRSASQVIGGAAVSTPLTDQLRAYFDDVDRQQGAVDVDALRRSVEEGVIMIELSPDKAAPPNRPTSGRRWPILIIAAATLIVIAGLIVSDVRESRDIPAPSHRPWRTA